MFLLASGSSFNLIDQEMDRGTPLSTTKWAGVFPRVFVHARLVKLSLLYNLWRIIELERHYYGTVREREYVYLFPAYDADIRALLDLFQRLLCTS
jgi:hypothetical protein